jgi:hypothetical protein
MSAIIRHGGIATRANCSSKRVILTLQEGHAWRAAYAWRLGAEVDPSDKRRDKSEKRLPTRGVKPIRGEHSGVIALARGPRQCPASRTIRILSQGKVWSRCCSASLMRISLFNLV